MSKFKLTILAFGLGGVAAVTFWFHQHPPGLTIIDPTRPPEPILEPTEVEKIHILQNTKEVFLRGGISPDDTSILVVAGTSEDSGQASWLNLDTRQFEAIDSKLLEFFPQGEIAWSSDQNALYLSNNANGDPVLVTLQRETGEIQVEVLQVQGRPLSLAPNGSCLLIESGNQSGMELVVLNRETGKTEKLLNYLGVGAAAMKKSKFPESQIVPILKEAEAKKTRAHLYNKHRWPGLAKELYSPLQASLEKCRSS